MGEGLGALAMYGDYEGILRRDGGIDDQKESADVLGWSPTHRW